MDKLNENETKDVLDEIYELREEKIDINNEALKEKYRFFSYGDCMFIS